MSQSIHLFLKELLAQGIKFRLEDGKPRIRAAKGKVTPALMARIKERKDEIAAFLQALNPAGESETIPVASRDGVLIPLSFGQRRLWFLDRLAGGTTAEYNMPLALKLVGPVDVEALATALQKIVERHESLRTCFPANDGEPYQQILEDQPSQLLVEDLSQPDLKDALTEIRAQAVQEAGKPFNLEHGPLVRWLLMRANAQTHVLFVNFHHIICDAWSLQVFGRELGAFYEAACERKEAGLAALEIQFADFAIWQRQQLTEAVLKAELDYWCDTLRGLSPLKLPYDPVEGGAQTADGAVSLYLDQDLSDKIRVWSREQGTTPFATLMAAYYAILARFSGQEDLCIGIPVAGRDHLQVEPLIGFFVNTLALRMDLSDKPSTLEILARLKQVIKEGFARQNTPLEKIVEVLQPDREGGTPFFNVVFSYLEGVESATATPAKLQNNCIIERFPFGFHKSKFELVLTVVNEKRISVSLEYRGSHFLSETARAFLDHLTTLLQHMVAGHTSLLTSPLLDGEARARILDGFNDTCHAYAHKASLRDHLEARAAQNPQCVAVVRGEFSLTYAALNQRANCLAHALLARGIGPESVVAILMDRSIHHVVALVAIVKTGAVYLPLDRAYPPERRKYMIEDAGAVCLLVGPDEEAVESDSHIPRLCLTDMEDQLAQMPGHNPATQIETDNPVYIIYTSGSTGKPKGVVITHGGLLNTLSWNIETIGLQPGRATTWLAGHAFDMSVLELWTALISGATLHGVDADLLLEPQKLQNFLVEHQIYHSFLPTPLAESIMSLDWSGPMQLAFIFTGGDRLTRRPPGQAPFQLLNAYGPTENSIMATCYVGVSPDQDSLPHIGKPIANQQLYILDPDLNPVPVGFPGELFVAGPGLARGYQRRPALSAERFIPNELGDVPGSRLYKTGDLVKWLPDGNIAFLGRLDDQVKIRGFRIELGEIEHALTAISDIVGAVVTVYHKKDNQPHLCAYLSGPKCMGLDLNEIRDTLSGQLPAYMVPSTFHLLEQFPLTPNGKVDRKALPRPELGTTKERTHVTPRNQTETLLAQLWQEVLGVSQPGMDDNFFALGGHSLIATRLISRMEAALGLQIPVRTLFDHPTIAGMATHLGETQVPAVETPDMTRVDRSNQLPLSFAQQRLWFIDQMAPGTPAYNMPFVQVLPGPLSVGALQKALNALVARHETLRTCFPSHAGQPQQKINAFNPFTLKFSDLSPLPKAVRREKAGAIVEKEATFRFLLATGPLYRFHLLYLGEERFVLFSNFHHIISDARTMEILSGDIHSLYQAFRRKQTNPLEELPLQYADFSVWQRNWLQGEVLEQQIEYWRRQLQGDMPPLELPADRARGRYTEARGAHLQLALPAELENTLAPLSSAASVTGFMIMLAAFQAWLYRLTGARDLRVGTPVTGRSQLETESMVGFFVNTLVMRAQMTPHTSFEELLAQIRRVSLDAFAHQDVPFEKLVEELQPNRDLEHPPFFQMLFNYHERKQGQARDEEDAELAYLGERSNQTAKFDLTLTVFRHPQQTLLDFEYRKDLYKQETMARFAHYFIHLLSAMVTEPTHPISRLPLLAEAEKMRATRSWNDNTRDYPAQSTLLQLFYKQLAARPDHLALIAGERRLTYVELACQASALARLLSARQVGPDTPVCVCLQRSPEQIIAFLAALMAGAAYVPLDPEYPDERLRFMIEDIQTPLVVTDADSLSMDIDVPRLSPLQEPREREAPLPEPANHPDHLAYIIYTSGSTGKPKGVAVTHRGVTRLLFNSNYVQPCASDVTGQVCNTIFDVATAEIWGTLLFGGKLVIMPRETILDPEAFARVAEEHGVNNLHLPTAIFNHLASTNPAIFAAMKTVVFAGEAANVTRVRQVLAAAPPQRLINCYGPTENTVYSSWYPIETLADEATALPIGLPISNSTAFILDEDLVPLAPGQVGELCVGGPGLARSYWKRSMLTASVFVPNPYSGISGDRLYRTGDLVRQGPEGQIEFIGRRDFQVKLRGFRIELGDIEAALRDQEGVNDALVLVRDKDSETPLLTAYLVSEAVDTVLVDKNLRERLPEYMVPMIYMVLPSLPLNPSGKVNRAQLPAPEFTHRVHTEEAKTACHPYEALLKTIWAEVLGLPSVSRFDSFFALGGHSLLATRLCFRIEKALGIPVSLRMLFENPDVASLARAIERAFGGQEESWNMQAIAPVPRDRDFPLTHMQHRLWMIAGMDPDSPDYNMPMQEDLPAETDIDILNEVLNTLIQRHEILRARFPQVDGHPIQRIREWEAVPIPVTRLSSEGAERKQAVASRVQAFALTPFNLEEGPLYRFDLLDLGEAGYKLLINIHHIVTDGISMEVLAAELKQLYQALRSGQENPLAPQPIQYLDYAVWHQNQLQDGKTAELLEFWKETLAGAPSLLNLPTDRPYPPVRSGVGALHNCYLDRELSARVGQLAETYGCSPFMVMLAVFKVALYRFTHQTDICVGIPVSGRNHPDVQDLVGLFINTLVMRTDLSGNPSFSTLLDRVRLTHLRAFDHDLMPFDQLVEELAPERDTRYTPLFQVMFNYQVADTDPEITSHSGEAEFSRAKFDLSLNVDRYSSFFLLQFSYRTDIFDESTVAEFGKVFKEIFTQAADRPQLELNLLGRGDETRQVPTLPAFPSAWQRADRPFHQLFDQISESHPHATALAGPVELTYGELNRRADGLAHALSERGCTAKDLVGVLLDQADQILITMLAVFKIGAAYLQLDRDWSPARLRATVEEANPRLLIGSTNKLSTVLPGWNTWHLEALTREAGPTGSPHDAGCLNQPALVTFGAEAGGRQRMTAFNHATLMQGITLLAQRAALEEEDGVLQLMPWGGLEGVIATCTVLLSGATLSGLTREEMNQTEIFPRTVSDRNITVLMADGASYRELAPFLTSPLSSRPRLKGLFVLDRLRAPIASSVTAVLGCTRQEVIYGLGEPDVPTTVWSLSETEVIHPGEVILGRPIATHLCYVRDPELGPVPRGSIGELCYDATDPDDSKAEALLQQSGILVRQLRDGNLVYVGRKQRQVRLRGCNIYLDEIENKIKAQASVRDGVVAFDEVTGKLVAHLVPETMEESPESSIATLRGALGEILPSHMVPANIVLHECLDRTDGDVDLTRNVLGIESNLDFGGDHPRNHWESALKEIWEETLGTAPIGIFRNFFELGGHSLTALRLVTHIEKEMGCRLSFHQVFRYPTIAVMAQQLAEKTPTSTSVVVPLQEMGGESPLFLIHPVGGQIHWYGALAAELDGLRPVYALQSPALEDPAKLPTSLVDLATDYITAIREVQPEGPYHLGGWSLGGSIAFEMAQQLVATGQNVAQLSLIDAPLLYGMFTAQTETEWLAAFALDLLGAEPDQTQEARRPATPAQLFELLEDHQLLPEALDQERFSLLYQVYRAHAGAAQVYLPQCSLDCDIVLVRAEEKRESLEKRLGRHYGWREHALSPPRLIDVPGNHYSLLQQPVVKLLATHINRIAEPV